MNSQAAGQQAEYNRVNQTQPGSTSTWTQNGYYPDGTPKWENKVEYTGSQARQYDQSNQIAESLNATAGKNIGYVDAAQATPLNFDNMHQMGGSVGVGPLKNNVEAGDIQKSLDYSNLTALPGANDFSAERERVTNALYGQATSRLDPMFNQREDKARARLANMGISENSDAYRTELDNFGRDRNDAYSTAMNEAIRAGGDEQSRIFGLALGARQQGQNEADNMGNFANLAQNQEFTQGQANLENFNAAEGQRFTQASGNVALDAAKRQQEVQEASYLRSLPINEMATLLGNTQGVAQPTFNPVPQVGVAAPDAMGFKLGKYQAKKAADQSGGVLGSAIGALGSVGAAFATKSDARVKTNIRGAGVLPNGIPTYTFTYIGDDEPHFGVMAQDVLEVMPEAVVTNDNGYMMVDYRKVFA